MAFEAGNTINSNTILPLKCRFDGHDPFEPSNWDLETKTNEVTGKQYGEQSTNTIGKIDRNSDYGPTLNAAFIQLINFGLLAPFPISLGMLKFYV